MWWCPLLNHITFSGCFIWIEERNGLSPQFAGGDIRKSLVAPTAETTTQLFVREHDLFTAGAPRRKSWQTQAGVPNHWEFPREMFMCIQFIFCMHKCIQMIINAIKCLIIVNDMQKMQKYLNLCSGHLMIEAPWLSARTTELPFGAKPYLCGSQEMDVTSARRGKCSCTKTGMEIDG